MQRFPTYPACPVCGDRDVNAAALEVRWFWHPERGRVVGHFVPGDRHTGYAGIMHGGLLSALLDECLAWACAVARRSYCVTGELTVRFKRPARLGDRLEVSGWTTAAWGPYQKAEGEARASDGTLLASVAATFSAMPRAQAEALRRALVFEPGDIDVLGDVERQAVAVDGDPP